jgi:DNA-binding beta-propeller fold protein YncE
MLGREGRGPGEFVYPVTIVQDDQENWYVCEYGSNDRIQKFSKGDDFLLAFGTFGTAPGQFQRPSGMVWRAGKLYVADAINNRIQVFSDSGRFIGVLGSPEKPLSLGLPYALQLGPDDSLYVVEYAAGRVSRVSLDGELLGRYGRTGGGTGEFATPWGISVDSRGRIRVADTGNRRIVELIP